jgi:hypothetical protein
MNAPGQLMRAGPAQSDLLIHLTGRRGTATPGLPADITSMTARQRLDTIVRSSTLRGFPPFGCTTQPVISFAECRDAHLIDLIDRGYEPWGLVFARQWVSDHGGGPVWPVSTAPYTELNEQQRAWSVRFEPGVADWLHEQEWRLLLDPATPWLSLEGSNVVALLVGDDQWQLPADRYRTFDGELISDHELIAGAGDPMAAFAQPDSPLAAVPIWRWNTVRRVIDRQ